MSDGERWAVELLEELRAARFTPAAWLRFLRRSRTRAREQRTTHAGAHRQAVVLGAVGLAVWLAAMPAVGLLAGLAGAAWWLGVVLMVDWHLGMLERPDGTALESLGPGNLVSLARLGVVPALPLLGPRPLAAVVLAAGASNVVDGYLARSRDQESRLGLWLDGSGDAFVLGTAAVLAASSGHLPVWTAALVVAAFAAPGLAMAGSYFLLAARPPRSLAAARVPGTALWTGPGVALLELPLGTELTAVGAAGVLVAAVVAGARAVGASDTRLAGRRLP